MIKDFEKIAAGEVIQRPASVVKELIENSIDAESNQIFVSIRNAGKDLIQIEDNGKGIEEEDLEIAFQRHTSSKLDSAEDLDHLNSLGFRGEALASIAAISQVEIISRPSSQSYGVRYVVEGSKKVLNEQCGAPIGTSISVKNLFFNLPVRRKYLKSKQVELGHITDILTRYSLAYPNIHFRLEHNGLSLLNSTAYNSPAEKSSDEKSGKFLIDAFGYKIQTIYGKNVLDKMYPLSYSDGLINIFGFFGHPDIGRSDRYAASLFINNRLVQNKNILQIIHDTYQGYLMRHKYPFFVLFLEIPPDKVDFNIHPSKKTVKFAEEQQVMNTVNFVIKSHITKEFQSFKSEKIEFREQNEQNGIQKSIQEHISGSSINAGSSISKIKPITSDSTKSRITNESMCSKKDFSLLSKKKSSSNHQTHFNISSHAGSKRNTQFVHSASLVKRSINASLLEEKESNLEQNSILLSNSLDLKNLPFIQYLNNGIQAGNTYLIFQASDGLFIVDQHAAHERINLEKVQKMFNSEKKSVQLLLTPIKIDVAPNEVAFVKENLEYLKTIGFEMEFFGGETFLLRTVPAFFSSYNLSNSVIIGICLDLIHMGQEKSFSEIKYEIMQYMACHQSLRGGDEIWDRKTIEKLLIELDSCQNPQHCAHGRPTYIKILYKELEKRFHRIV